MLAPIILYGSEVWGVENVEIIDRFQLKYIKLVFGLKQSTPSCMIYGELGILPLSLQIKSRVLNYRGKLINDKKDKICSMLYCMSKKLYSDFDGDFPWLKFVHTSLDSLGLSSYQIFQSVNSGPHFKKIISARIKGQSIQGWQTSIYESSKCLNYRIFKTQYGFEKYFNILPSDLAIAFFKFRCMNHKMPIETGRYFNLDRSLRVCCLCSENLFGDEFHYLFECSYFQCLRKTYLDNS
jgi:hypothetical protein